MEDGRRLSREGAAGEGDDSVPQTGDHQPQPPGGAGGWTHYGTRTQVMTWLIITQMMELHIYVEYWQLKSSFPKPDKSTFDENWVFNIVQNYIRASNRVKFRSR